MSNAIHVDEKDLLDLAVAAGALAEQYDESLRKSAAQSQDVASLIPGVVEALVENERIDPAASDKMAKVLSDPAQALHFIRKLAAHRVYGEVPAIGSVEPPTRVKAAGDEVYIERRWSPEADLESNRAFARSFGQ